MRIGDCTSLEWPTMADWQKMAGECGLGWPMLRERISSVCQSVLDRLPSLCEDIKSSRMPVPQKLLEIIPGRAKRILTAVVRSPT